MRNLLPPVLIVTLLLIAAACAAHYRGNVTLEDEYAPEPEVSEGAATTSPSRSGIRPPDCSGDSLPMPEYPPELLGPAAPVVRVRVDFLLDDEGVPERVVAHIEHDEEGSALEESGVPASDRTLDDDDDAPFLAAAEAAVTQWRCRPAWRYPRPDEPQRWVPLPYRTWIVFRFDAERVDRKAALERKSRDGGDVYPPAPSLERR